MDNASRDTYGEPERWLEEAPVDTVEPQETPVQGLVWTG
jgi:hypothetical protein